MWWKGVGNIKPTKDDTYQDQAFSLSSLFLSITDEKERRQEKHI